MNSGTPTIVDFGILRITLISFPSLSGGGCSGDRVSRERWLVVVYGGKKESPMSDLTLVET